MYNFYQGINNKKYLIRGAEEKERSTDHQRSERGHDGEHLPAEQRGKRALWDAAMWVAEVGGNVEAHQDTDGRGKEDPQGLEVVAVRGRFLVEILIQQSFRRPLYPILCDDNDDALHKLLRHNVLTVLDKTILTHF